MREKCGQTHEMRKLTTTQSRKITETNLQNKSKHNKNKVISWDFLIEIYCIIYKIKLKKKHNFFKIMSYLSNEQSKDNLN